MKRGIQLTRGNWRMRMPFLSHCKLERVDGRNTVDKHVCTQTLAWTYTHTCTHKCTHTHTQQCITKATPGQSFSRPLKRTKSPTVTWHFLALLLLREGGVWYELRSLPPSSPPPQRERVFPSVSCMAGLCVAYESRVIKAHSSGCHSVPHQQLQLLSSLSYTATSNLGGQFD